MHQSRGSPPTPPVKVLEGVPPGGGHKFWPVSLLGNPDVSVFTAAVDDTTAATCMTIRTGEVIGFYWVATQPTYRSREGADHVGTCTLWPA